ncbi:MAG: hypothetical protein ACXVW9_15990, partial [Nocardioidaceae bacterium]
DPAIDIILNRLPNRFISPKGGPDLEQQVGELARNLDENDAFVIFPEGRAERIDWLFSWWEEIDRWVEEHRPVELPRRLRRTRRQPTRLL